MADTIVLEAEPRHDTGKGASRRLRRLEHKVPAIVYGGDQPPRNLQVAYAPLKKLLESESFFTQVLTLRVEGAEEPVLLQDLQRHPARDEVTHMDLLRVDLTQKVTHEVPLHFVNEEVCVGVKNEGGRILHNLQEVEVECLPADIPEFIEVDMREVRLGQSLHLSDLKLPDGVTLVELAQGEDHDLPVVSVTEPRGGAGAGDEGEEGESGGED
jgi:large subunit ribosomal protein L25